MTKDETNGKWWIDIHVVTDADGTVTTTAKDIKQLILSDVSEVQPYLKEVEFAYDNQPGDGVWVAAAADRTSPPTWPFIRGEEFLFGPGRASTGAPFHTLGMVISFFFMWAISGMGQPGTMVRLMAFKESRTLKRAIITVTLYYSLIYLPLVFIFVAARNSELRFISPENYDSSMALVATRLVADNLLTAILAAILVAAPFAAVMSTVDSFLLLTSSSLVRDVYQRTINPDVSQRVVKWASYGTTAIVGVIVTVLALRKIDFLQYIIVFTGGGFASTFLAPVFLGLYWKRMTKYGAYASMIGGFSFIVGCFLPTWFGGQQINLMGFHPVFWGLGGSFALAIGVSLLTPKPPQELVQKYFMVHVPEKPPAS